ncbi:MAG: hypothetical protein IKF14_10110 [Atopobiaceae bacterium]|nr:hypothetical protein [Atopobiaceae bacterium]
MPAALPFCNGQLTVGGRCNRTAVAPSAYHFFNREQAQSFAACDKNIKIEEHPQLVYA